jgi:hypothetical protein
MGDQAPLVQKFEAEITASAVGADFSATIRAPFDGTVTGVTYAPVAAITGAATNNRTVSVVNHGQTGVGTNTVASLNFGNGTNAAAFDETSITLSGTASNLVVASGDILEVKSLHIGTGIADPGGTVFVEISRS